ncbi:hypothetical protein WJX72_000241 [[Myrmecia] bisecta]|uniref:Protein MEMO1 n=1 Tax=[Myrmecia] bisecta TaxID=41462 RepID=A0AAW1R477_9CHLO
MPRIARRPTHAGSWYDDDAILLSQKITDWMEAATAEPGVHARAIIGPHAGHSYCGRVMAYAYKQIDPSKVSRIFLLGPSHHVHTRKCLLSTATIYSTPLGDVHIDSDTVAELRASGEFGDMELAVDEAEHSLELHVPFIAHHMGQRPYKLVPIMVGALRPESEAHYGRLLSPYLEDPGNLFVFSSDFCHWGSRFGYTFFDNSHKTIHQCIKWLDRQGMDMIEKGDPAAFTDYLRQYGNTICGRHPIGVCLNMLQHGRVPHTIKFTQYDQSSRCLRPQDSSVSYASAVITAGQ